MDPTAQARAKHAFTTRGGTLAVIVHRPSSARRAGTVLPAT